MSRRIGWSLAMLVALTATLAADARTDQQIWVSTTLFQTWARPPSNPPAWWAKRADGWEMFTPTGEPLWSRVRDRTSVVAIAGNSVQNACLEQRTASSRKNCADLGIANDRSLDQFFRSLRAYHLHAALEIGLLLDTQLVSPKVNPACATEALSKETSLRAVLQKIKDAGGELDDLRMDEPYIFGVVKCGDTPEHIAQDLRAAIEHVVRFYFPHVAIGEAEPMIATPEFPRALATWADTFAAATGERLAFEQLDPQWGSDRIFTNFRAAQTLFNARAIPFGIIYTAGPADTDLAWTRSAIDHFSTAESGFGVALDEPVFQSWTAYPTDMLPEQRPGTVLNVAAQYLLPKTQLSIATDTPEWQAQLRGPDGEPVVGAKIRVVAVDVNERWPMTNRVVTGTVPNAAAYAVVGIRANAEGAVMADPGGSVEIGPIQLHYHDGASAERVWRYAMPTPLSIALSPTTTVIRNLGIPGESTCHGTPAVSIEPGSAYTFEAPMAATGSAANAGYVTIIFLNGSCQGLQRSNISFGPSQRPVATDAAVTDASGRIELRPTPGLAATQPELRGFYDGDNRAYRPSMAIREIGIQVSR